MAREPTLGQRGVLAVNSDLSLFAAFPEDKVLRLDSGVHRLRVSEDFARFSTRRGTRSYRFSTSNRDTGP